MFFGLTIVVNLSQLRINELFKEGEEVRCK